MTSQQAYPIRCRIRNEADVTRVDVFDDIGGGGWFGEGLTPKDFAAQLAKATGALEVHVSSGGGDCFDGIAIANAIRNYKGAKTTFNDGIAASIASVIFQAGDERVAEAGSMVMIHDAFGMVLGNADEARKFADTLDQVSDNIASIYASRAGGTTEQWRDAMREETWYTADEAVAVGLADRVGTGAAQLPAGMDLAAFSAVPGRIAAALRKLPQAKIPDADGSGSGGVLYGAGGGGGGGLANLTVTAGSPSASYTITGASANGSVAGPAPVILDADGNHGPMTGSHAHSHPAYRSQGGDSSHAHDHSHDGDASHRHSHDDGGDGDGAQDHAPQSVGKKGKKAKAGKKDRDRDSVPAVARLLREHGAGAGADCDALAAAIVTLIGGGGPGGAVQAVPRILGIESMPLANEALPVHHTATADKPWDGPGAVAAMPNDAAVLRYCHAWQDTSSDDGTGDDPDGDADDKKASYKFPHHKTKDGPANLAACRNGLARLPGADIPDSDRAGVEKHLRAHLDDGGGDGDDDAGNHAHTDLSGIDLEQIRAALKGANA